MEYKCLCDRFEEIFDKPPTDADGNEIVIEEFKEGFCTKTRKHWYTWFAWYPIRLEDGKCVWLEKVYRQSTKWTQCHWGGCDNYNVVEYKRYSHRKES